MKSTTRFLLLLSVMLVYGSSQSLFAVQYQIPLPERTYSGGWRFSLEAVSQKGLPNVVQVSGYDTHGDLVLSTESEEIWANQVFRFVLTGANPDRVQSLVISAESPLHGFLWIENESSGQINGVTLEKPVSSELILPHIPRNYFKWKVSFASMGIDSGIGSADVSFAYFNDVDADRFIEPVREGLEDHGYLRRTPNHDFLTVGLGTESAAAWGLLQTSTNNFRLTGYQTFARLDDSIQTCAMELSNGGSDSGVVVFSPEGDMNFDDYFIFVNSGEEPVDVDFQLMGHVELDGYPRTETVTQNIEIGGNQKRISVLGLDLFPDFEGVARALSFTAYLSSDGLSPEEPADIQAIHLQSELQDQALGGHWFTEAGDHIQAWMTIDPNKRSVLELANMGEDSATLVLTLTENGESRFSTLEVGRGMVEKLDDTDVVEFFNETTESLAGRTIFLDVRTAVILGEENEGNGPIVGKLMVFSGQDLAIVNPIVIPVSD